MNRIEFTYNLCNLILKMTEEGESPILDFVKRSSEEQKRLYDAGKSKCDGINTLSYHQFGKAADIYFMKDGQLVDPIRGFSYWHDVWEEMGGGKIINWDQGHFEVK